MTSTSTGTRGPQRRASARLLGGATACVLLALVTACGSSAASDQGADSSAATGDTQSPTVIHEASLVTGDAVPLPRGDTVLTITGKVSADNKGNTVAFDLATLNALELVRVELYEPWAKKRLTFGGPELSDLLDLAGVDPDATSIHMTALDDYQVDLTMDEIRAGGILVATASGSGGKLPIDKGGPARIVFEDGVEAGAAAEQWIWSLKTIDVR
jgi:hypothetical protein